MVAVMILGAVAVLVSPVVSSASDVFVQTMKLRQTSERVGFALERIVRMVREIEPRQAGSEVAISLAEHERLELAGGESLALVGDELRFTDADGQASPLCTNVEHFLLEYIGSDGRTDSSPVPGLTRTIRITLRASGCELRAIAFIRSGATL